LRVDGRIPTYCHDTVVRVPKAPPATEAEDRQAVGAIGAAITDIVVNGEHHAAPDRHERVRRMIREFVEAHAESHPSRQS
jgi:HD superfamily phosphodiesterase